MNKNDTPVRGRHASSGSRISSGSHASRTTGSRNTKSNRRFDKTTGRASGRAVPRPSTSDAGDEPLISRRGFLFGAAGLAAVTAVAGGVTAISNAQEQAQLDAMRAIAGDAAGASDSVGDLALLSVPNDSVFTTEDCTYIEDSDDIMYVATRASLPYGTILWATDDEVAACLLPTETASPLTQIGLLSLTSGSLRTAIERPVGEDDGFQIYDVRANSNGVVWTESEITSGDWRVYHAPLSGLSAGTPTLIAEENSYWEMPDLAISGNHSFWQMVPKKTDGTSSSGITSKLMRAPIGAGIESAEAVYEAKGYMACPPSATDGGIAFVPRSDASGTYYQLTYIDSETGEVVDSLVLPSSMKPTEVSYGNNGFSFAFDGIYAYGNGISNLGTYTPATVPTLDVQEARKNAVAAAEEAAGISPSTSEDAPTKKLDEKTLEEADSKGEEAVADIYSASEWFRFPRAPLTSPVWWNNWFIVKSTSVVAGVDLTGKQYFTLSAEGNGENYGEFLASSGAVGRLVTYANLDYTPLNGDPIKECAVRVWGSRL